MAITARAIDVREIPSEGNEWQVSLHSADVSDCENIVAAAEGKAHYLKKLHIRCASEISISIGSGEDDNAVETIHLGPIPLDAGSGIFLISFGKRGMKCVDNKPLTIDATGAGAVAIYAEGKTCRLNLNR